MDSVTWKLEENTLFIAGKGVIPKGDGRDKMSTNIPWSEHKDNINYIVIEPDISEISECAFAFNKNLEKVIIPNTVTH